MKLRNGFAFVLLALCMAGCENAPAPSPSASVPSTEAPSESGSLPETTVTNGGGGGKVTPSKGKGTGGALGSPIDYNPTFVTQTLSFAKKQIASDLADKCAPASCDVKTNPKYEGAKGSDKDCVVKRFDYDRPLRRGATITIVVTCSPVSSEKTTTTTTTSSSANE